MMMLNRVTYFVTNSNNSLILSLCRRHGSEYHYNIERIFFLQKVGFHSIKHFSDYKGISGWTETSFILCSSSAKIYPSRKLEYPSHHTCYIAINICDTHFSLSPGPKARPSHGQGSRKSKNGWKLTKNGAMRGLQNYKKKKTYIVVFKLIIPTTVVLCICFWLLDQFG